MAASPIPLSPDKRKRPARVFKTAAVSIVGERPFNALLNLSDATDVPDTWVNVLMTDETGTLLLPDSPPETEDGAARVTMCGTGILPESLRLYARVIKGETADADEACLAALPYIELKPE